MLKKGSNAIVLKRGTAKQGLLWHVLRPATTRKKISSYRRPYYGGSNCVPAKLRCRNTFSFEVGPMRRHGSYFIHETLLILAVVVYLASFVCPDRGNLCGGFVNFILSLFLLQWFCPVWFANPILWVGFGYLRSGHRGRAFLAGSLAFLFGLSLLTWRAWQRSGGGKDFDLSGVYSYPVWLLSMVLFTLACLFPSEKEPNE